MQKDSVHQELCSKIEHLEYVLADKCAQQKILRELIFTMKDNRDFDNALSNVFDSLGIYLDAKFISLYEYGSDKASLRFLWSNSSVDDKLVLSESIDPDTLRESFAPLEGNDDFWVLKNPAAFSPAVGIKSCAATRLSSLDQKFCFMAIAFEQREFDFTKEITEFISWVAEVVSNMILRREDTGKVRRAHNLLNNVVNGMPAIILAVVPASKEITFANDAALKYLGADIVGKPCYTVLRGKHQRCNECPLPNSIARDCCDVFEWENSIKNGMWMNHQCSSIEWTNGDMVYLLRSTDMTRHKLAEQRIEYLAFTDDLTGLSNRHKFDCDMLELLSTPNKNGYLMLVDMDNFKHINDAFGHTFGDKVLMDVANYLLDVTQNQLPIYRFRDDEFVIIGDGFDEENVVVLVRDIVDAFKKVRVIDEIQYCATVSIGIAPFRSGLSNQVELIQNADSAIYAARENGPGMFAFYARAYENRALARIELETKLRSAINGGCDQFKLYYQPIVDMQSKKLISVEALIRWFEPTHGFVAPTEFIHICEHIGLIIPLGEWVLNTACKYCKKLNDKGFPDLKMNINMSVKQMQHNGVVDIVSKALSASGVDPSNIVIEVTEGIAIGNISFMTETLRNLKALGVLIAMDDFGVGYATLSNLLNLPLDIIKIDRSFAFNLKNPAKNTASYIRAVADLARNTDRITCVEGVETYEQFMLLKELNIDSAQGYLFSKPVTGYDLENYLNQHRGANMRIL